MKKTRLLIVDEHLNVQTQLAARLRREVDFEVVGQCSSCSQLQEKIHTTLPHVVIVDPVNQDGACLHVLRDVLKANPHVLMVVLTAVVDTSLKVDLEKIGIETILHKGIESSELVRNIREAATKLKIQDHTEGASSSAFPNP